jgi:metal-responsive CopG/Arc/MetJ family transcriptional regulator
LGETHLVVRVQEELYELLKAIARDRGQQLSSYVREVIKTELARLSYLSLEEKKALGIATVTSTANPSTLYRFQLTTPSSETSNPRTGLSTND